MVLSPPELDDTSCLFCAESVLPDQDGQPVGDIDGPVLAHRECLLRQVMGGIGHLVDHDYWCLTMHDSDAGKTLRQSALECDAWVHRHGAAFPPPP